MEKNNTGKTGTSKSDKYEGNNSGNHGTNDKGTALHNAGDGKKAKNAMSKADSKKSK